MHKAISPVTQQRVFTILQEAGIASAWGCFLIFPLFVHLDLTNQQLPVHPLGGYKFACPWVYPSLGLSDTLAGSSPILQPSSEVLMFKCSSRVSPEGIDDLLAVAK